MMEKQKNKQMNKIYGASFAPQSTKRHGVIVRIAIILFILGVFMLGFMSNEIYKITSNKRAIDGLWLSGDRSYEQVKETAQNYDYLGDWICVNVNGMDFKTMVETCKHEAGHEIFAEMVEKDDSIIEKLEGLK